MGNDGIYQGLYYCEQGLVGIDMEKIPVIP